MSLRFLPLVCVSLAACAESSAPAPDDFGYAGTGIQFSVAPLTLDALSDACYSFIIENEAGQLVVGRGPGAASVWNAEVTGTAAQTVCASRFGNSDGGDVSYVAPCDASVAPGDDVDVPADGVNTHTVTLWVDALCASGTPNPLGTPNWNTAAAPAPNGDSSICNEIQAYQNPCGSGGCELQVACVENADTPVTFNFTIMGQADQGFFDLAVNFDDIFCSAKFDTCTAVGTAEQAPIEVLFGVDDARDHSGVAALACTAGPGAQIDTKLHKMGWYVGCYPDPAQPSSSVWFYVPPLGDEGVGEVTAYWYNDAAWQDAVLGYGMYYGAEALDCGSGPGSCKKVYWNMAFNLERLAEQGLTSCYLFGMATASSAGADAPFWNDQPYGSTTPGVPPAEHDWFQYPAIHFGNTDWNNVAGQYNLGLPLVDANGNVVCDAHPLDGSLGSDAATDSRVVTGYRKYFSVSNWWQGLCYKLAPTGQPYQVPGCEAEPY